MNPPTAQALRQPRTDTRLLDDIVFGLHGYWAVRLLPTSPRESRFSIAYSHP